MGSVVNRRYFFLVEEAERLCSKHDLTCRSALNNHVFKRIEFTFFKRTDYGVRIRALVIPKNEVVAPEDMSFLYKLMHKTVNELLEEAKDGHNAGNSHTKLD